MPRLDGRQWRGLVESAHGDLDTIIGEDEGRVGSGKLGGRHLGCVDGAGSFDCVDNLQVLSEVYGLETGSKFFDELLARRNNSVRGKPYRPMGGFRLAGSR